MGEKADDRTSQPTSRWKRVVVEAGAVVLLLFAGALSSWTVLGELGDTTDIRFSTIMQSLRSPVMFAAGKGMRDIDSGRFQGLDDFYSQNLPAFDVAEIPADYAGDSVFGDSYQLMHYHLMYAIGITWRFLGVSRWAINVLAMVCFTAFLPVLYSLFRLTAGPLLSFLFVVWLSVSPALLVTAPSVRDFVKAPFLLGGISLLAWLVAKPRKPMRIPLWVVSAGLIAGIGFGFRQEVALLVPLAVLAFGFFMQVEGKRPRLVRGGAAVSFLAVFIVSGWVPIWGTLLDNGSASAQAFVQGASQDVERRMDFGHASYTHHYDYTDMFDWTVVNAYARRTGDRTSMPGHFTSGHGQAGQRLVRQYWARFPGDFVGRAVSALWQLPETPHMVVRPNFMAHMQPNSAVVAVLERRQVWHAWFTGFASHTGWAAIIVSLALLFVRAPRLSLFLGVEFAFMAAYPSLLYEFRHFFHLSIVPYWALATVLACGIQEGRQGWRNPEHLRLVAMRLSIFLGLLLGVVAAVFLVQAGARTWQDRQMMRLYDRYAHAALKPVEFASEPKGDRVLVNPTSVLPNLARTQSLPPFETAGEYLVLDFQQVTPPLCVGVEYEDHMLTGFSRNLAAPLGKLRAGGAGRFFVPVYCVVWPCMDPADAEAGGGCVLNTFGGFLLTPEDFANLRGVYRVEDANAFDMWPYIIIPEDRAAFQPHKTRLPNGSGQSVMGPCNVGAQQQGGL